MGTKPLAVTYIDPTAIVHSTAQIGEGTKIWAYVQIGEHAVVGKDCVIGNGVYIDRYVKVGNRVRIHNKALLYHGVIVEDDVFIGPGVCLTNDPAPRSGKTRNLKGKSWIVRKGATIGANATVLPDLSIGSYAFVGAGSMVTHPVPHHTLVYGNPARAVGVVCRCGLQIKNEQLSDKNKKLNCPSCGATFALAQDRQLNLQEIK